MTTTLTPELIATLKALSPDDKERAVDLLIEDDNEAWRAELRRRVELVASGNYESYSLEQVDEEIRRAVEEARAK